jgi:DNA-binding beta-propeller fold protein YncE
MTAREAAPEFPASLPWVNVPKAPTLAELRGRVVLLHFWNASNIHSQHVALDLRHLENKYSDGLSVLGVHTPHFDAERQSNVVLQAVNRHYLRHPVANDYNFDVWRQYGVTAWPTMAVIDTEGGFAGLLAGEGRREEIDGLIGQMLDDAAFNNSRNFEPMRPVSRPEPRMALRFPGKILVTENALFVADSGHNRILECTHDGDVRRQIGSGNAGYMDGGFEEAAFNEPQGMVSTKDMLYIADRGNHSIRRVRLNTGEVETLAGTGTQGYPMAQEFDHANQIALNSPWDLALGGERLFIAMAGQNQIWNYDLSRNRLSCFAGTGMHRWDDGEFNMATFARPTGLSFADQTLYVADSDSSAIRAVRVDGRTQTLVGAGVFEFGDADGLPAVARLQGAMGVCVDPGGQILWVADTYNNRLKAVSLRGGGVKTINLPYKFQCPTDVVASKGRIWIANCGAHEIVRIDTGTGQAKRLPIGE